MVRVSVPLAQIPRSESGITSRDEAKIVNGYVYNDGIMPGVTKRPGRTVFATMSSGEILFAPFHDANGNVWWIDDSNAIWKNGAIAHVQDTDWQDLATFSSDSTVGTVAWTNPSNAASSNDSDATASIDDTVVTEYLKGLDLSSVDVPSGATITGVQVRVEKGTTIATDTGFLNFSTFANDSSIGTTAWSNPSNAQTSNDSRATVFLESGIGNSQRLKCTDLATDVPTGATVTGIEIVIERSAASGFLIGDLEIRLYKAGVISGDNKAIPTSTQTWPSTDTTQTYGGAGDLWGLSWTASDVNSTGFGISIRAHNTEEFNTTARVDHVKVKIYYNFADNPVDNSVRLVEGGVISGDNKASVDEWPTTDTYVTYGGPADLWGLTLTEADVEAADFGVVISATSQSDGAVAHIDHVQMKIFYETTSAVSLTNLYTANGITWAEDDEYIYVHGGGPGTGTNSDYFIRKDLIDSASITEITDTDHPIKKATADESPPGVVALHGYFFIIGNHPAVNSGDSSFSRIYNSDLGDPASWTATGFIASASPGFLKYLTLHKDHIAAFGEASIDFFYDAGNAVGSPLKLRQDINYNVGLVSHALDGIDNDSHSMVAHYGDSLFFIGRPHRGAIGIYVLKDFQLQRISTPAVDRILEDDGTSVIRGVLSFNNKDFLLVNPDNSTAVTLAYDIADNIWYEWAVNYDRGVSGDNIAVSGSASMWQASGVQDNGTNYEFAIFLPKINQIPTPNYPRNTKGLRKFCNELTIEADTPGSETLISVSFSDDDYQTFSTARTLDINNKNRKLTRWGSFIERAYKLAYTGDNNIKLYSVDYDIDVGER